MESSSINNALFTKTQQRVLSLLYGQPTESFYLNEIVRFAGLGKGTITRELSKLVNAGVLTMTKRGNQNHYQANQHCPIFPELKGIVSKTFGVTETIHSALEPLLDRIDQAFIYGSIAKGTENANSDVDLMIVSDESLSYSETIDSLANAEAQLRRTINPTMLTFDEFQQRLASGQSFITRVMEQPKLWIKQAN